MYFNIFVGILALLIKYVASGNIQDERVIIGSSVGGFIGLVSEDKKLN